jgi:CheY-like chemotaxis protein
LKTDIPNPNERFSILLVDEDLEYQQLVKTAIRNIKVNMVVSSVFNGSQLMDFLHKRDVYKSNYTNPDIIIIELELRDLGGLEAISEIKNAQDLREIPILVLTKNASKEARVKALSLGVSKVIVKPVDFDKLTSVLNDSCSAIIKEDKYLKRRIREKKRDSEKYSQN